MAVALGNCNWLIHVRLCGMKLPLSGTTNNIFGWIEKPSNGSFSAPVVNLKMLVSETDPRLPARINYKKLCYILPITHFAIKYDNAHT